MVAHTLLGMQHPKSAPLSNFRAVAKFRMNCSSTWSNKLAACECVFVPQKAYHGLIPLKRWLSAPRPKGILNIQLTTSMFESSRIQQHCSLDRLHPKFDPTADQNWFFGPPCFFVSYLRWCPKSWGHPKNHVWFISWKFSSVYTYLCYKIVFLIL